MIFSGLIMLAPYLAFFIKGPHSEDGSPATVREIAMHHSAPSSNR